MSANLTVRGPISLASPAMTKGSGSIAIEIRMKRSAKVPAWWLISLLVADHGERLTVRAHQRELPDLSKRFKSVISAGERSGGES